MMKLTRLMSVPVDVSDVMAAFRTVVESQATYRFALPLAGSVMCRAICARIDVSPLPPSQLMHRPSIGSYSATARNGSVGVGPPPRGPGGGFRSQ